MNERKLRRKLMFAFALFTMTPFGATIGVLGLVTGENLWLYLACGLFAGVLPLHGGVALVTSVVNTLWRQR